MGTKQNEKKKQEKKRKIIQTDIEKSDKDRTLLSSRDSMEEDIVDITKENEISGPSIEKRRKTGKRMEEVPCIIEDREQVQKGNTKKKSTTTSSQSKNSTKAKKLGQEGKLKGKQLEREGDTLSSSISHPSETVIGRSRFGRVLQKPLS